MIQQVDAASRANAPFDLTLIVSAFPSSQIGPQGPPSASSVRLRRSASLTGPRRNSSTRRARAEFNRIREVHSVFGFCRRRWGVCHLFFVLPRMRRSSPSRTDPLPPSRISWCAAARGRRPHRRKRRGSATAANLSQEVCLSHLKARPAGCLQVCPREHIASVRQLEAKPADAVLGACSKNMVCVHGSVECRSSSVHESASAGWAHAALGSLCDS